MPRKGSGNGRQEPQTLQRRHGSGRETHISLRMAVALGYIEGAPNEPLLQRVDGVVAQLYRLANP